VLALPLQASRFRKATAWLSVWANVVEAWVGKVRSWWLLDESDHVLDVAVSADAHWIATIAQRSVHLYTFPGGVHARQWEKKEDLNSYVVSENGSVMAIDRYRSIVVRRPDEEDWEELMTHSSSAIALAITPDGCRAVVGDIDGWVTVWDLEHRKLLARLATEDDAYAVAISRDGKTIASVGAGCTILRLEQHH
jgi:WD40 repeat protein